MDCLKKSDVEILSEYLNAVVIPQWNTVSPEKPMTARGCLLLNENKGEVKKKNATKLDMIRKRMKKY